MLGLSFLNEIVNRKETIRADQVLNELREKIKKSLGQTGKLNETKDGMDISFCMIDIENGNLQFAGAFNSLLIIRENQIIEYKADRMPIGIHYKEKPIRNNIINIKNNDCLYLFSDGYCDQFGGEEGLKFQRKSFYKLLLDVNNKTMSEQKQIIETTHQQWVGEKYEQLDDILVIGIKI